MIAAEHTNQTIDTPASLIVHDGTFVASFGGPTVRTRNRPRIGHDPLALAAAGEALNRGIVIELHPEDVMPALDAGLRLARLERDS